MIMLDLIRLPRNQVGWDQKFAPSFSPAIRMPASAFKFNSKSHLIQPEIKLPPGLILLLLLRQDVLQLQQLSIGLLTIFADKVLVALLVVGDHSVRLNNIDVVGQVVDDVFNHFL